MNNGLSLAGETICLQLPGMNQIKGAFHFFGTRHGIGAERLLVRLRLEGQVIQVKQVHGDGILKIATDIPDPPTEADALMTDTPHRLLVVSTADCVPVLIHDPITGAVAAIHSGWRGTLLNIAGKVVREMALQYGTDPQSLYVAIGPSAGACCYEVGEEVWEAFEKRYPETRRLRGTTTHLNLTDWNRRHLVEAGVPHHRIFTSGFCTLCRPDLFYSYRRDCKPGQPITPRGKQQMESGVMKCP